MTFRAITVEFTFAGESGGSNVVEITGSTLDAAPTLADFKNAINDLLDCMQHDLKVVQLVDQDKKILVTNDRRELMDGCKLLLHTKPSSAAAAGGTTSSAGKWVKPTDTTATDCQSLTKWLAAIKTGAGGDHLKYVEAVLEGNKWKGMFGRPMPLPSLAAYKILENELKDNIYDDFIDFDTNQTNGFHQAFEHALANPQRKADCTETGWSVKYYQLIGQTHETASRLFNTLLSVYLNTPFASATADSSIHITKKIAESMLLEKGSRKPDMCMTDQHGRVLFKGEEKKSIEGLEEAYTQLTNYCFGFSPVHYAEIRYTYGYVAAGSYIELLVLDHHDLNKNDGRPARKRLVNYDLSLVIDRIKLVAHNICLHKMIWQLSTENKPDPAFHCSTLKSETTSRIITLRPDGLVEKLVRFHDVPSRFSTQGLYDLFRFYDMITIKDPRKKQNKLFKMPEGWNQGTIVNTVRCVERKIFKDKDGKYWLEVLTVPICRQTALERVQNNLSEFKTMLTHVLQAVDSINKHGFSHNDVRWPNIMYYEDVQDVSQSRYLLLDFEHLLCICTKPCTNDAKKHIHGSEITDITQICRLVTKFPSTDQEVSSFVKKFDEFIERLKPVFPSIASLHDFVAGN